MRQRITTPRSKSLSSLAPPILLVARTSDQHRRFTSVGRYSLSAGEVQAPVLPDGYDREASTVDRRAPAGSHAGESRSEVMAGDGRQDEPPTTCITFPANTSSVAEANARRIDSLVGCARLWHCVSLAAACCGSLRIGWATGSRITCRALVGEQRCGTLLASDAMLLAWAAEVRVSNPAKQHSSEIETWASHHGEPTSIPGRATPGFFASGNRTGQCRWSTRPVIRSAFQSHGEVIWFNNSSHRDSARQEIGLLSRQNARLAIAFRSNAGMKGLGKREIPEKNHRPAASSSTIPTCENPGVSQPGIEPGRMNVSCIRRACGAIRFYSGTDVGTNGNGRASARIVKIMVEQSPGHSNWTLCNNPRNFTPCIHEWRQLDYGFTVPCVDCQHQSEDGGVWNDAPTGRHRAMASFIVSC
ncbi:hypothetical protein PR048_003011 [Dryococelus australis]|uniref:Uncharacterized protein n=1 Tax=Dryococelus australis TaxID=614101 RepID=A0ABQ9ILX2_9NEOP|nr:hypothetical protein PR048_003011 [Dryococelus australis]